MAEDSALALDRYIDEGHVIVALADDGSVGGHLQLIDLADAHEIEIKNMAVLPSY